MRNHGNIAVKMILAVGIVAFVLLMLLAFGLRRTLKPNELERVVIQQKFSPFDRERAFRDLQAIVALGPRPPGSEALAETRRYIKREIALQNIPLREHTFETVTPLGPRTMVNLVAVIEGSRPGIILLGNHYDTKYFADFPFAGANDGGSTTAWMLEMARALGPRRDGRTLWMTWFDGEEAFEKWSETDGIYGSRRFVDHLRETGELAQIAAMINVDMIGDAYLRVMRDQAAPAWLQDTVWDTAARLGYRNHFGRLALDIQDDHIPFRRVGIPTLEIIDFSYGGSILDHQKNWHTRNDTLDKVRPESLQAIADVLYHALPAIEGYLNSHPRK